MITFESYSPLVNFTLTDQRAKSTRYLECYRLNAAVVNLTGRLERKRKIRMGSPNLTTVRRHGESAEMPVADSNIFSIAFHTLHDVQIGVIQSKYTLIK